MKLDIKNIDVEFKNKSIVQDACISVKEGEFVGIIGPNGSGKSTLLKTVYRIYKPKLGTIYLDGKNIFTMPIKDMATKLGVVSQFNHIAFDIKVEDMVLMGRNPHKKMLEKDNEYDYKIVREMLEKVDMIQYANRSFSTLSGGEKQRVLLARALAQQVEFLTFLIHLQLFSSYLLSISLRAKNTIIISDVIIFKSTVVRPKVIAKYIVPW